MADDSSIPRVPQPPESKPESGNPNPQPDSGSATSLPQSQPLSNPPPQQQSATPSANPDFNPNPSPGLSQQPLVPPPPPSINPYARPLSVGSSAPPPPMPSFRPAGAPVQAPASVSAPPQFAPAPPNPNLPNFHQHQLGAGGAPPPGVSATPAPGMGPPAHHLMPANMYQVPFTHPQNALARPPYGVMPNGYAPPGVPPGTMPPPGAPRYPPYGSMIRPTFPPRPPGTIGFGPSISRPPLLGVRPPIIAAMNRPSFISLATPVEKPQTTVYVGKIASTVEDDFILSLLKFCGAVKSWKRAQDPSNGTPKGFGFCEFESAEGVLRALRLLTKFNIDGQELVLNVNQATRDYLERYVGKKKEEENKAKDTESEETKEKENVVDNEEKESKEKSRSPKPSTEDVKKDDNNTGSKDNDVSTFGLVNDEDREADRVASEKIMEAVDERLKTRPLPPPPPRADVIAVSKSEVPTESGDRDSDLDGKKDDNHDDEMSSEAKYRAGAESPGRGRRYDNRSREKDREEDLKRDKEREFERLEREREREKARRDRQRGAEVLRAERLYKDRLKEWEAREKDKEYQRKYDKEREKEKERDRKRLILDQEDESDDDSRRRRRRSDVEDKRKRRRREKEEDMVDRVREEEEIAEAEKRAVEEQERKKEMEELQQSLAPVANGTEEAHSLEMETNDVEDQVRTEQMIDSDPGEGNHIGKDAAENSCIDDAVMVDSSTGDKGTGSGNGSSKKLGFGLAGSGKRAAVPSVFNQEDDDAHKDKKMRPLVPIDYSTEELQAIQSDMPPNLAAAAEYARLISSANNAKEEKMETMKDRSRHSHDRHSSHRERDRKDDETGGRGRDGSREKSLDRERGDNHKIVDAKQLIDMIPKTKDELFSYDINWAVYDKHGLHEKMRPWISRKITEFLGEEETTLVDYIVSSIQEHVKASQMLELLQSILDEEAEMFVLKMWRMLIFEIKRVETGLSSTKSKA